MRLLGISAFSIILVAMLLAMTHFWGKSQVYTKYDLPFFQNIKTPFEVHKTQNPLQLSPPMKAEAKTSISEKIESKIWWLDVSYTLDQKLILLPQNYSQALSLDILQSEWKGPQATQYNLDFLKKIFGDKLVELNQVISALPQDKFILNILDNVFDLHTGIINYLSPLNVDSRVLIQSDTLVVMTSIKEKKPEWAFGSSHADIMKLLSMNSMWILPAGTFKGDAYITPLEIKSRSVVNSDVITEMKRRYKTVIIGPIYNNIDHVEALRLQPDGVIIQK